jgi:molybdate transport system permease protein
LLAMGPHSFIGRFYTSMAGKTLPFSFEGLLFASVLYSLPFAVRPFVTAFAAVDRQLIETSWCLGVSKLGTFRRVVMPLSWTGIVSGLVLCFAHTIGEFGVVLMVGGNIPGETRTISISIYDEVQSLNYAAANQSALLLLSVACITLCITYALQRRPGLL